MFNGILYTYKKRISGIHFRYTHLSEIKLNVDNENSISLSNNGYTASNINIL